MFGYNAEGTGGTNIYSSPHESLFQFPPQPGGNRWGATPGEDGGHARSIRDQSGTTINRDTSSRAGTNTSVLASDTSSVLGPQTEQDGGRISEQGPTSVSNGRARNQPQLVLTYAGTGFDSRRMCSACTEELRGAVISSGHDLELWHTVDHERRALLTAQRRGDVLKARWAEHEQQDRQVTKSALYRSGHNHCSRVPMPRRGALHRGRWIVYCSVLWQAKQGCRLRLKWCPR